MIENRDIKASKGIPLDNIVISEMPVKNTNLLKKADDEQTSADANRSS